jgi:drug/metabolite transporter (DMT)-like permease
MLVAAAVFSIVKVRTEPLELGRVNLTLAAGAGAVVIIANLFLMLSMSGDGRENVSKILVLTALYPAIPVLIFRIFLRESITPTQWIGIFLAGVAMVLITNK